MDDLISRQALIAELMWVKSQAASCSQDRIDEIIERVKSQPTIEPKKPTRSEIRRLAIQHEVFPVKRGECDTCSWHNACNWETLMKDWNIEHGYCAAYRARI